MVTTVSGKVSGDIIKTFGLMDNIVGVVKWADHEFTWAVCPPGWKSIGYNFASGIVGHLEIIGDIHNNPKFFAVTE